MRNEQYNSIKDLVLRWGLKIKETSGTVADIGTKKKWLTEQDIEIEKDMQQLISTFSGENKLYSEEINDRFIEGENVWIADPISHTFSYIHGLPHFCIVVSHLHKGNIVYAIVHDPFMNEAFEATSDGGSYLNDKKIQVNDRVSDLCILFDVQPVGKHTKETNISLLSQLMTLGRVKSYGSVALHYAYVACGRAEMAVTQNKDTFPEFAGKFLVEKAGGILTDYSGNELATGSVGILASNGKVHTKALELLKNFV